MTKWKLVLLGIGFVAGLGSASLLGSRKGLVRGAASTLLSYGMDAKRKVEIMAEKGKESISDLVAESEEKTRQRHLSDVVVVKKDND
ncbi:MAG: hypothetical protein LBF22_02405 [Deltaproteobacteria bacterium]|nr:hypothetical protein [Deltaproteobacteria bacterium]